MAEHLIKINRGAARILAAQLAHPAWYNDLADASRACALLELPELDQDPGERKDDTPEMKAWLSAPVEFTLTERQRDTVKKCLQEHAKTGRFGLNRWHGALIRAFGLEPKDG